jgi:hypothetical protein
LDEHWQDQTIALMLRRTNAGDIGKSDDGRKNGQLAGALC